MQKMFTNTKTLPISLAPRVLAETTQNIPRVIHQTFKTNKVPNGMFNAVSTWINKNPEYAYEFYDDARMINFIHNFDCTAFSFTNEQLNEAFNLIKQGAGKADIFRYCVLYVYGGVYSDIDSECLVQLKDIIDKNDDIIVIINSWSKLAYHHTLAQWCMMINKNHPIIKHTLELVVTNILTKVLISCFGDYDYIGLLEKLTGPAVYNKVFLDAMKIKTDPHRIKRFMDISEKVVSISLLGLQTNVRFIHYACNHYENPAKHIYCIPKYVKFKYDGYYTDLDELGLKSWADSGQTVF